MIIDARTLETDRTIETEVCIVGGGPAGIILARELINQSFRVCLVESGGFELDHAVQSLSEGNVIGQQYPPLSETRLRQLGGTAHTWEAELDYKLLGWRSLPLDPIDFEQRDWLPYSGWSFTREHLDPFYQRAHEVSQLGPFNYTVEPWESDQAFRLPFQPDRLTTSVSQYGSRTLFTQDYPREVGQAENITVLLHATITEIETDDDGRTVNRLRGGCLQGNPFWIKAKIFILAAGGIENARLLLLSNRQQPMGVGNQHDLVGRFFMEHPSVVGGMLRPAQRRLFDQTALYDMCPVNNRYVVGEIRLNEGLMQREQLLNSGIQLYPRSADRAQTAQQSLQVLSAASRRAQLPKNALWHFGNVMMSSNYFAIAAFWKAVRSLPTLRRGVWSYFPYEKRKFSTFELVYQIEQAPDPHNRILLSREQDALGQNKAEIHWKLNDIDISTIKRVQTILQEEFRESGLGQLDVPDTLKFFKLAGHHHMGTTRMHDDPKQGVVNADSQVHGISNLYITGSSVFPTSGYANPTLTIIALALRLADRMKLIMQ